MSVAIPLAIMSTCESFCHTTCSGTPSGRRAGLAWQEGVRRSLLHMLATSVLHCCSNCRHRLSHSSLLHCFHNFAHAYAYTPHTALCKITMDRLATILAYLRSRDNIRDFIDGLEDSECWPYPGGESRPIAPTPGFCECCGEPSLPEVVLRGDKLFDLVPGRRPRSVRSELTVSTIRGRRRPRRRQPCVRCRFLPQHPS